MFPTLRLQIVSSAISNLLLITPSEIFTSGVLFFLQVFYFSYLEVPFDFVSHFSPHNAHVFLEILEYIY